MFLEILKILTLSWQTCLGVPKDLRETLDKKLPEIKGV